MQMKLPRIDLSGWRIWAAALVVAGIVHIVATFAIGELTGQPAHSRLAQALPLHKFEVLPAVTPQSQLLPYLSPDFRYAVCRFRTAQGSVSVLASLPDAGWSLSIFTRTGENAYAVAGQAGRATEIALQLIQPGERFLGIAQDAVAAQPAGAPLAVQVREGIVILRAPVKGFAYRGETEAELRRAQCSYRRQ